MVGSKIYLQAPRIPIEISSQINSGIIICSHERSGTHFLMNSLSLCTHYTSKPYLDYEANPLGGIVSFYSERSAELFFSQITSIKADGKNHCISSLIKSHFPVGLKINYISDRLKIVYIYRNPVDTLISLWKFFWKYPNEGPCLKSPLELAQATPSGNSQRYQICNYKTYFERWAEHVSDSFLHLKSNPNIHIISYRNLKERHLEVVKAICDSLEIELTQDPVEPNPSLYWKGAEMTCSPKELEKLEDYCLQHLSNFKALPPNIMKA